LVRDGADQWGFTFGEVYLEMLSQILLDFSTLPPFREITAKEIKFFYNISRPGLIEATKPTEG